MGLLPSSANALFYRAFYGSCQQVLSKPGQIPCNKLSQEAQEELLRLGQDLPRLWYHPASSVEIKKRILRTVVKEIVVNINDNKVCMLLHWQGGDHTELRFEKRRNGQHRYATDSDTIDLIQKLARTQPDSAIANLLNRLGRCTAHGHTWTASRVGTQRRDHGIAAYCESDRRACGELLLEEAATALNVSRARALRLIDKKLLPAAHACVGAPWVIRKEDLEAYLRQVEPSGPSHQVSFAGTRCVRCIATTRLIRAPSCSE